MSLLEKHDLRKVREVEPEFHRVLQTSTPLSLPMIKFSDSLVDLNDNVSGLCSTLLSGRQARLKKKKINYAVTVKSFIEFSQFFAYLERFQPISGYINKS